MKRDGQGGVNQKKDKSRDFFRFAGYDLTIIPTAFHPRELRRQAHFFKSLIDRCSARGGHFSFLSWISMTFDTEREISTSLEHMERYGAGSSGNYRSGLNSGDISSGDISSRGHHT
jgi:hypothetical protein